MSDILVTKYSGEQEPYDPSKVKESLRRSGADKDEIRHVLEKVQEKLYDGITTRKLYHIARQELERFHSSTAAKYSLREALARLGPDGFPFEDFVARLMTKQGYAIHVGDIHEGASITHEVDVCASSDEGKVLVECKFHNKPWIISHVQTVLYVKARFEDLREVYDSVLLVTNTKFSDQAIRYAEAQDDMRLLGWRYPDDAGLEKEIERLETWPITFLELKNWELSNALDNRLVLLEDVASRDVDDIEQKLDVPNERADELRRSAHDLLDDLNT